MASREREREEAGNGGGSRRRREAPPPPMAEFSRGGGVPTSGRSGGVFDSFLGVDGMFLEFFWLLLL